MPTILVSLVSEQTVPNYLFIKEFQDKVDRFLFLSTQQMEHQNKTQMICDTAGIGREQRIKTNISDDVLNQSIEKLGKLNLSPENHYLVNLTGGTKIMAIAVWRFFTQFKHTRFFYVPINKGIYHELFEDQHAQAHEFTYQMGAAEYLNIYGINYECDNLLFNSTEVSDIFNDVKAGNFYLEKFPRKKLRNLNMPDRKIQIYTKWFEEYVYYRLRQELQLSEKQIITGVRLFSALKDTQSDLDSNDNEIDVLMLYRNRPFLIECKFSIGREKINTKALTDYIYKLAAINKRCGLSARSAIFTLSDLSQLQAEAKVSLDRRLSVCGINRIFDRNSLTSNFMYHLQEFLK